LLYGASKKYCGSDVWGNLKTGHVDQRKMGHSGPTDYPLFIA
jgi:hypothetical protein